jgi:16S rRNA (guanine966-N2)-methyltransferase
LSKSKRPKIKQPESTLRIIGGAHRGRKLPIANLEGLRPTSDRIRETVFNWLQFDMPGLRVLDLFAGTGALGLEALSRDAESAVFIEPQAPAAANIRQSLSTLNISNAQVVSATAEQYLKGTAEPFDLVFVDPPFAAGLWESTLLTLVSEGWLNAGALVYVECPANEGFELPKAFTTLKDKTGGKVRFRLLQLGN